MSAERPEAKDGDTLIGPASPSTSRPIQQRDTALPTHDDASDIVSDDDDFLYQDSDYMLESDSPAQYLKGTVHIKGPNTMCRIIFLTICLAG